MSNYLCIEGGRVVSMCSYLPNVPATVSVIKISDEDCNKLSSDAWVFDVGTNRVVPRSTVQTSEDAHRERIREARAFLARTDWQVLRHIREQALGYPTSLTGDAYLALERQRHDAAGLLNE